MTGLEQWYAFRGLAFKEVRRVFRIWMQTILPSTVTITLYFLIFGCVVGSHIGLVEGYPYMIYITPGLIMMPILTNAYSNVVSSFYLARFNRSIEEILVSPMPNWIMILGFCSGGAVRGLTNGVIVTIVGAMMAGVHVVHPLWVLLLIVLSSLLFSLLGLLNGIFARKFDDLSLVPTFILTPLIYLGGVFYSVQSLPPFWRDVSLINPIHYIISAFRYAMLGVGGTKIFEVSLLVVIFITIAAWTFSHYLLSRGVRIKT